MKSQKQHFNFDEISLGVDFTLNQTTFKVWSSSATEIALNIYKEWDDTRRRQYPLKKGKDSVWFISLPRNMEGYYYSYTVNHYGTLHEVVDPYAVASSPNSSKGYLIDLEKTNPEGWHENKRPDVSLMDTVIYETHVRDLTVKWHDTDNLQGTFNGVTKPLLEKIKALGVTHIQWMPVFDFATVDELGEGYNWGYDPLLFNVVEGSYASDVYDASVRIKELKSMIMRCHEAGLRVIMDVVYNHTYYSKNSNLNRLGAQYFYRMKGPNKFANGSGCGNELATEKKMVRKFIVDSLLYWQKEYKIDGFRFDLMGLYDLETVETIEKELKSVDKDIILYGEPWTAGGSALPYEKQFRKGVLKGGHVGYFNDDFRNTVKGDNDSGKRGYIGGITDTKILLNAIMGSHYSKKNNLGCTEYPWETINYLTSHDNLNLFDKISRSFPGVDYETKKKICGLCFSILLTSIGIPFIQGGAEMMVTKQGHHNTYNMGDEVNAYDWSLANLNQDLRHYVQKLIEFRRKTFVYQLTDFKEILACSSVKIDKNGVIKMEIVDKDKEEVIYIYHNGSEKPHTQKLLDGPYRIICDGRCFHDKEVYSDVEHLLELPTYQSIILKKII